MLWADRAASWRHDMAHVSLMHGWVPTVVQVVTAVVLMLAVGWGRATRPGTVTVNSPPMIENRPELSSSCRSYEATTPVVAQGKTSNNCCCRDPRFGNPLVAGSSPARPTSEPIFQDRSCFLTISSGAAVHRENG